jgi:hypothetical protein
MASAWDKASADKYRIDPDFVVPEPTAATFFCFMSEEEYHRGYFKAVLDGWHDEGVKQFRCTLVNDEFPHEPYPHGVYFEGWTDKNARMLPFGEAEAPDKGCYPPLVAQRIEARRGETVKQGSTRSARAGSEGCARSGPNVI